MKLHLITFATGDFVAHAEALAASALEAGFARTTIFGPADLKGSDFALRNAATLEQKRGGGYWLWKPYLIRRALEEVHPDDVVFYCDAGRSEYYRFDTYPRNLVSNLNRNNDGFLLGPAVPHLGIIGNWTKRDCLELMGADHVELRQKPLLMTWGLWKPTTAALRFLEMWRDYAEDPRCLTDMPNTLGKPNHAGFIDHRHDQSIMSILAQKLDAPYLDLTHTLTHKLVSYRPLSEVAQTFYKRPQNLEDMLAGTTPLILAREHLRLKKMR